MSNKDLYRKTNQKFVKELKETIEGGLGITPFLGSGCSSPSGILMGQEFDDYLGYVVYRCVSLTDKTKRWNILLQGWPERPKQDEVNDARLWASKIFQELCENSGIEFKADDEGKATTFKSSQPYSTGAGLQGCLDSATTMSCESTIIDWASELITITSKKSEMGHPSQVLAAQLMTPILPKFLKKEGANYELDQSSMKSIHETLTGRYDTNDKIMRSQSSPTSYDAICEKGIRVLYDWRATLQFLASLRHSASSEKISLGDPDQTVIDRFNVHITRGRKPNLTHQMLAQLSMSARMRVYITTNFDTLLEEAFTDFGRQLAVISLGTSEILPHADLVHERDTLIKIHGDMHQTRADYTLDDHATNEDKCRFFNYVRGNNPEFDSQRIVNKRFIPSQILVIGYSGSDRRCNEMLKYILDADKDAKIYWICFSDWALESLQKSFAEKDYQVQIVATVTERPDLLLYDFYQKLNLTLPSAGTTYQFPDRVMPAKLPERSSEIINPTLATSAKNLSNLLIPSSFVVIDGPSGALNIIHETFITLAKNGRNRIWLELEDFPNTAVCGAEIRTALSVKTGSLPLGHLKPLPQIDALTKDSWKVFFEQLCAELSLSPAKWIIGFYGRNGPGGCTGWDGQKFWNDSEYIKFWDLLSGLNDAGFSILYAPYTKSRKNKDLEHSKESFNQAVLPSFNIPYDKRWHELKVNWINSADFKGVKPDDNISYYSYENGKISNKFGDSYTQDTRFSFKSIVNKKDLKILFSPDNSSPLRRCFSSLHAATLFRQSRHFSAFLNDALFRCPNRYNLIREDNDAIRLRTVNDWLDRLEKFGVFYLKPGGFAWAYRDIRMGLRHLISKMHTGRNHVDGLKDVTHYQSRNHFFIGEWYSKAFEQTKHPMPMLEAAHHFYQAAIQAQNSKKTNEYKSRFFYQSLIALHGILVKGGDSLRYWASDAAIEFIWNDFKSSHCRSNLISTLNALLSNKKEFRSSCERLIKKITLEIQSMYTRTFQDYRISSCASLKEAKVNLASPSECIKMSEITNNWWKANTPPILISAIISSVIKDQDIWKDVGESQNEFLFANKNTILDKPAKIHETVQELVEWAFIFIRRAKRVSGAATHSTALSSELTSQKCYLVASVMCNVALDLSRLLPIELMEFSAKEKAKAASIYGLALGHLGRFQEAYRRLGEARAIIRAMNRKDQQVILGIAELRRAEVLMLEASECGAVIESLKNYTARYFTLKLAARVQKNILHRLNPNRKLHGSFLSKEIGENVIYRYLIRSEDIKDLDIKDLNKEEVRNSIIIRANCIRQAKIGDAWRCLEEARRSFSGRTHSPRWWRRLYTLELRAFGETSDAISCCDLHGLERFRMLVCRTRRDTASYLYKLFKQGLSVSRDGVNLGSNKVSQSKVCANYLFALQLGNHQNNRSTIHSGDLPLSKDEMSKGINEVREVLNELKSSDKSNLDDLYVEAVKKTCEKLESKLSSK